MVMICTSTDYLNNKSEKMKGGIPQVISLTEWSTT
ncbi:Uncharacterized [Syntrophomonas zehnderi OL-4]|uniref:Uncharacterized n=1 Tax=Syntrophomonas zehnderi OL-4 TaxID=690567 RepID=A0A0E4G9S6_9FIRM|nr:Uncharacterized [Syntrophomonas zehnderi OL-4]